MKDTPPTAEDPLDPELEAIAAEATGDGLRFIPGRFDWVALDQIEPHPDNTNEGDLGALAARIDELGFYGVLYVQEPARSPTGKYRLLAGEHRWLDLRRRRAPSAPCWIMDVDADDARRILVGDNRSVRLGRDRPDELAVILQELAESERGLAGTAYDGDDLDMLLADLAPPADPTPATEPPPPPDDDLEPVVTMPSTSKLGDLWHLGDHRLIVGDCFDPVVLDRLLTVDGDATPVDLVLTDPPFAIYGSSSTGIASDVADDKMVRPFFARLGAIARARVRAFGHVYVHCDWRSYPALYDGLKDADLSPKNLIVWDKGGAGLGSNYANTHEFVAFFASLPHRGAMSGSMPRGQRSVFAPNIYRANRVRGDDREHNAAKPVELLSWLIENSTDSTDLVLDCFAGSGSTLIAAHSVGRRAALVEVEPRMADVICRRWQRVTGGVCLRDGTEEVPFT